MQNEAAVEPLLALLRQQGRAVPEDVSVVAICPDQVAVQASVRLTSVAIPAQEMGRHAVEQLVAKLEGRGERRSRAARARVDGTGRARARRRPP